MEPQMARMMTPDEAERFSRLETSDAKRKAYKKKWYEEWKKTATKEEMEAVRTKERERKRAERQTLTDEEREAIRKADRERKTKDKMTAEQLEARRAYNREYKRKQRESKKAEATKEPIADMDTALKELKKGTVVLTEKT
jgi:serine phosphatase RsbU (regulator of sigma subunit)